MENKNTLNIIALLEQNPIKSLSKEYQSKLVNKIKEKFNTKDKQVFLASFYCYLKYNKDDFVIDLDDVWKWIGFSTKANAKKTLGKNFAEPEEYIIIQLDENLITNKLYEENFAHPTGRAKILHTETREDQNKEITNTLYEENFAHPSGRAKILHTETRGGQNREQILMTVKTFKKLCLKANTKKSNEIHDYYLNLEEIFHETISEQSNELQIQLQESNKKLLRNHRNMKNLKWFMLVQTKKIEVK
jgi:hypothetical protein